MLDTLRAALGALRRRLIGHRGDRPAPDAADERVRALTRRWEAQWGHTAPAGDALRAAFPDRWVRFHSLPGGAWRADDDDARAIVRDRHRVVLADLDPEGRAPLVIAEDGGPRDGAAGWTTTHLPGRWPWRTEGDAHFSVREGVPAEDLDRLLDLAAAGEAHVVVSPTDLHWLYAPYPGGADVFVDRALRADLIARHPDWLSHRPDGL